MAITKEQVFVTADELAATGLRPTLEAIRQRTGGSYSTLAPLLKAWRADRTSAGTPLPEPAPQAVTDRATELAEAVWAAALELQTRLASADTEAKELRDQLAAATELARTAEARITEIERRAAELQAALDAALARAAAAEARAAEAAAAAAVADRRAAMLGEALAEAVGRGGGAAGTSG